MSVVLDNILLNKSTDLTYNLVLNSNDRIAGTHNNATFNIDWGNFLPVDNPEYKICYTFQSTGGYYSDGIFQKVPVATGTSITTSLGNTAGNSTLVFVANTGLTVGNYVYGTGITTGTYITNVTGTGPYTATLSTPLVATVAVGAVLQSVLPASVGVTSVTTSVASTSANNYLQFATNTGLTVGNYVYGVGIATGTYITSVTGSSSPYTAFLSIPIFANLASGTVLQSVTASTVNSASFSSARVLANFGGKSYSYDSTGKGQSLNLGVISRDTQTLTSKSNTYSAFYCQNPPRVISRPINNQLTVSIVNNSVFQGGVSYYNPDNSVASYGTAATGSNYLCDTLNISQGGSVFGALLTDMTPWTMLVEFIPINKKVAI